MRRTYVTLVSVLLASLTTAAWADPGKDESGHGRYEDRNDREAWKRALEYRREASKDRREYEREAAKAWAEMEREERKHYEEMLREERKHREEMRREAREHHQEILHPVEVETIIYVPWDNRI